MHFWNCSVQHDPKPHLCLFTRLPKQPRASWDAESRFCVQSNNIQTHVDGVASVYFINMSRGKDIQCHTLLWDSITLPRCNNIQSHISWDRTPITCDTRYLRWCNNVLTHKPVGLDVFAPKENLYKTIQSHSFTHNNVQCVVQQRPMSICLNGILYKWQHAYSRWMCIIVYFPPLYIYNIAWLRKFR